MKISRTFLKSDLVFFSMQLKLFLLFLLIIPSISGIAYGHTVDVVGEYRVEIGWMNEPVVSGETNAIEFYVSPLIPCPEISEAIKCAESQEFQNGISDLRKTVKIKLIYKDENITLPLSPDHNISGKYYAFVKSNCFWILSSKCFRKPLLILQLVCLCILPKVDERSYIEFPEPSDITVQQMIDGHTALIEDVSELKDSVDNLEDNTQNMNIGYMGIGLGIVGITIAIVAIIKSKKN